jgi:fluoroacetyl-CoA thioesterase
MRYQVAQADTATAVGSGDVPVLATPRLIAWMEAATVQCALPFLESGQTTVGTAVRIAHRRASPVGSSLEISAEPPAGGEAQDGAAARRLTFAVRAIDDSGTIVAAGEIDRAIVDRDRFLGQGG